MDAIALYQAHLANHESLVSAGRASPGLMSWPNITTNGTGVLTTPRAGKPALPSFSLQRRHPLKAR
jgi:hypothetical protein